MKGYICIDRILTVTQMAIVNKGLGVGLGILCAVLPRAVMVKPVSHGLKVKKKKKCSMLMMRLQAMQKAEARLRVLITNRAR